MTTVKTKEFIKELEWCARFICRKTTIPILSNVALSARGDLLTISATDLEIGGITSLEVVSHEDFDLTIPVHGLVKYLKKVTDETLHLIPEIVRYDPLPPKYGPHMENCDGKLPKCCEPYETPGVACARMTIKHGDDDQTVTIEGMSMDSYPVLPSRPLDCFEIEGFGVAIPRALTSIPNEESRFTLNGALLNIDNEACASFISTDGHRLSIADLKLVDPVANFKALIPKAAMIELARMGDSAYVSRDEHHFFFRNGDRTIITRLLTGNFPDWERVMPSDLKYSVSISTAPLKKVIDRVAVFADERSRAVRVTVNGLFQVLSQTTAGSATGKMPFNGPDFACPYQSGFNADYISDFLKSAGDSVAFSFVKADRASIWSVPGWKYVLMPMRDGAQLDPCVTGECSLLPPWPEPIQASPAVASYSCPQCQRDVEGTAPEGELCPTCAPTWEPHSARETSTDPAPVIEPKPKAVRAPRVKPPSMSDRFASWVAA